MAANGAHELHILAQERTRLKGFDLAWSAAGVLGPLVDDPPVVDAPPVKVKTTTTSYLAPSRRCAPNCRRATSLNDIWHSSGTLQPSSSAKSEVKLSRSVPSARTSSNSNVTAPSGL